MLRNNKFLIFFHVVCKGCDVRNFICGSFLNYFLVTFILAKMHIFYICSLLIKVLFSSVTIFLTSETLYQHVVEKPYIWASSLRVHICLDRLFPRFYKRCDIIVQYVQTFWVIYMKNVSLCVIYCVTLSNCIVKSSYFLNDFKPLKTPTPTCLYKNVGKCFTFFK